MSEVPKDPRQAVRSGDRVDEQPVVGGSVHGISPFLVAGIFAILAVVLFLFLNSRRQGRDDSMVTPSANQSVASVPPPLDIAPPAPAPPPAVIPPVSTPVAATPVAPQPPDDTIQRLHAPAIVVDLQSGRAAVVPVAAAAAAAVPAAAVGGMNRLAPVDAGGGALPAGAAGAAAAAGSPLLSGATGAGGLGANEQFAARASEAAPDPAVATQMTNLDAIVTQGATIPAVMESAINSDLPGFTRAVVSRDVLSFDGKNILIPRGSRVIGQYRNALSLGQSRVFIIWTRVIRPDGVTVQIGSPGEDALGRGGLTGDVNSHFFARFGGAILLSVLNAGAAAVAGTPSTQISIGSPAAAAGAAASASIPTSSDILPTISVKQGAAINIFVARDLDFSAVKSVK